MDIKRAQGIVSDTLQNTFDKTRFIRFTKELLNHIEESPFIYRGNLIPDAYEKSISSFERVGKYTDGENKLDILIVNLKKETSLDRARSMQRNFIAWYLNGSRGGELKDAALVAFVSPNQDDWRFSLVKMDYRFEEGKNGKTKVKEEFTPARRRSFLVGKNENSHTAKSRLAPIIADDTNNPTLQQLEEAFNIEVVTKEFFEKYRELFHGVQEHIDEIIKKDEKIKAEFKEKKVGSVDFSKKLLGQIVFLYFLQKKGWFGVERDVNWGTGPKNFLRLLFEGKIVKYNCFFNDILEPLFYEALNKERDDDFYSKLNCKIPFLNGELFDPIREYDWIHTDILLSDEIFSNKERTKEGDIGTGILDVFDRYNFTVKEDEPLEKDVAIDPEMLGKVFENLLEVTDRKSKGTYYTPREIVHYMCQESLINYLETECKDETNEKDIRYLVQFGESSVEHEAIIGQKGEETKTYYHKLPESIRKNAEFIDKSLANIRVCDPAIGSGAFPVGMMNEVVRTRNALTNFIKNKEGRTVYEFKRHAIQHCIYGVDVDLAAVEIAKLRLWLSLVVDEDDIKKIKPLPNLDFRIVQGDSLGSVEINLFNQQLFSEMEELKPLYFDETNLKKKYGYKKRIDTLIKEISNNNQNFDFKIYFSEVFHEKNGFDVIIANPPYVFTRGSNFSKGFKDMIRAQYETGIGKLNLFSIFIERGLKLLKPDGDLIYIVPNTLFRATPYKPLRKYIVSNYAIKQIVDLREGIFENVTASTTIIEIARNKDVDVSVDIIDSVEDLRSRKVSRVVHQNKFINSEYVFSIYLEKNTNVLFDKLLLNSEKLGLICRDIINGIVTPKGKDKFITNKKLNENYKPFLEGKDIDAYIIRPNKRFILFDRKKLHRARPEYVWDAKEKLIIRRIGGGDRALFVAYDNSNYYTFASTNLILLKENVWANIKYVLALLNSKLLNYYYVENFTNRSSLTVNVSKTYLELLPIKKISVSEQKQFIELADRILAITRNEDYTKNSSKKSEVRKYQERINQMVYKLYGLTEKEIKVVEDSTKN